MRITVTQGKEVWKSPDGQVKIYEITLDNGTKLQTKSGKIADGGTFDVESYEKNGRSYVRQLAKEGGAQTNNQSQGRSYEADPNKISSIEWQTSLKTGREIVHDWYEVRGLHGPKTEVPSLEAYKAEVVNAAITVAAAIEIKPNKLIHESSMEDAEVPDDLDDNTTSDDLPPLELYDE